MCGPAGKIHPSCPRTTAVSVEVSTPRVPSRHCQGEAQYSAARMRAPLSGLLARVTLVTPLSPHTTSCTTNNVSEGTERKTFHTGTSDFLQIVAPLWLKWNKSCSTKEYICWVEKGKFEILWDAAVHCGFTHPACNHPSASCPQYTTADCSTPAARDSCWPPPPLFWFPSTSLQLLDHPAKKDSHFTLL